MNSNNIKLLLEYSVERLRLLFFKENLFILHLGHSSDCNTQDLFLSLLQYPCIFCAKHVMLEHMLGFYRSCNVQERIKGSLQNWLVHINLASTWHFETLMLQRRKMLFFITVMAGMFEPGTLIFTHICTICSWSVCVRLFP